MVGSICAQSSPCGPIRIPSSSSTTTTGIASFGEMNITTSPATAAMPTITSTEVVSTGLTGGSLSRRAAREAIEAGPISDGASLARVSGTQYYCAATLDGYIADADDGLGWLIGYEGSYEGEEAEPSPMSEGGSYDRFYEDVGALISGSTTYEFVLDHIGEDEGELALCGQALLGAELAGPAAAAGRTPTSASSRPTSRTCTRRCSTPQATATSGSSAAATSPPSSPTRACWTSCC